MELATEKIKEREKKDVRWFNSNRKNEQYFLPIDKYPNAYKHGLYMVVFSHAD